VARKPALGIPFPRSNAASPADSFVLWATAALVVIVYWLGAFARSVVGLVEEALEAERA
jgi:hypothetical protein